MKNQIIKSAANIKKKVRMLKEIKNNNDTVLETIFKPITDPLNQMKDAQKKQTSTPDKLFETNESEEYTDSDNDSTTTPAEDYEDFREKLSDRTLKTTTVSSPPDDIEEDEENKSSEYSFSSVNSKPSPNQKSLSWSLSSEVLHDVPFGLRWVRGKLMMGTMRVYDGENTINIGGVLYEKTPGLLQLLTEGTPNLDIITEDDKHIYKQILIQTNAHRRDNDPKKPIKSNKGLKYNYIIKPLFRMVKSDIGTSNESLAQGKGLKLLKHFNKNTDFVYWDDPNELVDRLKILIASRDAGNTGLDNEIISIIEELREANIIN